MNIKFIQTSIKNKWLLLILISALFASLNIFYTQDVQAQISSERQVSGPEYDDKKERQNLQDQEKAAAREQASADQKENTARQQQRREESVQGILQIINREAQLPSFTANIHRDAPSAPGARNIGSLIFYILDFVKLLIGGVVVFFIIIGAIQIIIQGGDVEEVYKKQKNSLLWSIVGLVLMMISDSLIKNVFYGERGEFLTDESSAKFFAEQGSATLKGVYTVAEILVAAIALVMIVFHGSRMIMVAQNEEEVKKSQKAVAYAAVGLALIGASELVIKGILFKDQGTKLGVSEFYSFFIGITNFLASFIGILSLLMFLYSGITLVFNAGNEEAATKAKNTMKNTILGILLALAAFAFTTTLIQFKS